MKNPITAIAVASILAGCVQLDTNTRENLSNLPNKVTSSKWQDDSQGNTNKPRALALQHPAIVWTDIVSDPKLSALIADAITNNPNLQASKARTRAANAFARSSSGARWPNLDFGISKHRTGSDTNVGDSYTANVTSSWEIDIWGRLRNTNLAAQHSAQQQQALLTWAHYSLAAQASKLWIDSIESKRQWHLAQQREKNLADNLAIIEDGFRSGIRPALDVYSARAEFANSQSNTFSRQRLFQQTQRQLAALLGLNPQSNLQIPDTLPVINKANTQQLSLSLIETRPDVSASFDALNAQLAQLKVARANRLPRLSFTGQYGASNNASLSDALQGDDLLWSALGNLTAPLFRGGQLKNEEQRQQALLDANVADYKDRVLNAVREVEQSLDNETLLSEQQHAADIAKSTAAQAQGQAFESYVAGLSNLNTWLQAQRLAFDRRSQLMQLQAQRLKNRLDLHLALGGAFGRSDNEQEQP